MRRIWKSFSILVVVAILFSVTACAREADNGATGDEPNPATSTTQPGDHEVAKTPGEVVLLIEDRSLDTEDWDELGAPIGVIPSLGVYESGLLIQPGPQILIYPGPALPNLLQSQLTLDVVDQIETEALASGLDEKREYGNPAQAPAWLTTVTIRIGDKEYRHEVVGLDSTSLAGLDATEAANREALSNFLRFSRELLAKNDDPSEIESYVSDRFELWVRDEADLEHPVRPEIDELSNPVVEWTVPWPLHNTDCEVVDGEVALAVNELFSHANTLTRFRDSGVSYVVRAYPLWPHQPGCEPVVAALQ